MSVKGGKQSSDKEKRHTSAESNVSTPLKGNQLNLLESIDVQDSTSEGNYQDTDTEAPCTPSFVKKVEPMEIAINERAFKRKVLSSWGERGFKRNMSFSNMDNVRSQESHFCTKLYHTKRRVLNLKDYHDEARAMRDIEKFLEQPIVLFKVHHTLWEDIVEEMILKLNTDKPDLKLDVESAMKSVISNDGGYVIPECIQGISQTQHGPETEQSFIVVIGTTNTITENQVVMCLLDHPFNFGTGAEEVRFICIVLCPTKTKHTKSAVQVARTYSTLFSDDRLRHNLLNTHSPEEFAHEFELECTRIHKEHNIRERANISQKSKDRPRQQKKKWYPGRDVINDIKNRSKHYISDFTKDVKDCNSIQKIISTTLFLYFSLLLPSIAFGVLNSKFTEGNIDAKNVLVSQALAGMLWMIFGGQHLVIHATTIPIVIYTKVIYTISKNWAEDGSFFYTLYAITGLSNAFFLVVYGLTGASKIMVYCSRSTEEILGLFISIALIVDSVKYIVGEFNLYYCIPDAAEGVVKRALEASGDLQECYPTKPILALLLVLITVFVGVQIFNFKYSPYLTAVKRVIVADYALAVAVAVGTFLGAYVFMDVDLGKFEVNEEKPMFEVVRFVKAPPSAIFTAIGLGLIMSILFFMENNIAASIVNNPANKLQKGFCYHYDMMVSGFINAIMSIFGLPFVHGCLPHSPLHVRALADIEEHIENGHLSENVVYVRETRLTTLISHIMIAASVLLVPYPLNMIPIPVLYGLFVFLSVTALRDFQLWERLVLIFTEQSLYPPFHYVRKVPQKIIHCFTLLQLLQLCILCVVSFAGSAYLKMFFPFVIFLLMPVRMKLLPKIISDRHLIALDGDC